MTGAWAVGNATISIHDVAEFAGVSAATVSNVLNKPSVVSAHTRARVIEAMEALDFRRNEQAASLRLGKKDRRGRAAPAKPATAREAGRRRQSQTQVITPQPDFDLASEPVWPDVPCGRHVHVYRHGEYMGAGIADGALADGSTIWIRFDNGSGRRLLSKDEGFCVLT